MGGLLVLIGVLRVLRWRRIVVVFCCCHFWGCFSGEDGGSTGRMVRGSRLVILQEFDLYSRGRVDFEGILVNDKVAWQG